VADGFKKRSFDGGAMSLEKHNDFIQGLLRKKNTAEAFSWLDEATDESSRTLGELDSNEKSIDLVAEAYRAGAVKVMAVDIDTYPDGHQNTGKLIVELPEDKSRRKAVFDWCGKQAQATGYDSEEDGGQSHLFVMLD
jgi:hypothetical protein